MTNIELKRRRLVRVALPVPRAGGFDYVWELDARRPEFGSRVRVPFGNRQRIGVVIGHPDSTPLAEARLKAVEAVLDDAPVIGPELMASLRWAADYYHHGIGEVLSLALPGPLRKGRPETSGAPRVWRATARGLEGSRKVPLKSAPRQAEALRIIAELGSPPESVLRKRGVSREVLKRLKAKGAIESRAASEAPARHPRPRPDEQTPLELSLEQRRAVEAVAEAGDRFHPFLLHGVTGSGKTEVFLRLIRRELDRGRQTLLLVPEIGLTPQLIARLTARFGEQLAVLHSGLTDTDRLTAWHRARAESVRLIVGTRSAVFAPLPAAGLIIVDEEHDPSFKQHQGFRYSARDLAIVRARKLDVRVLLASATPSLESYRNATEGRYRLLSLPSRIGSAGNPRLRVVDLNRHASRQGLSTPMLAAIEEHLERGNQVLLFINRRGFAPALFCPSCERTEECDRCDARMTVHARDGRLRCHHCGRERQLQWSCPSCGAERIAVGAGTQRVTAELQQLFPDFKIARLDRDAVARRDSMASVLASVERGETRILVGTQMLTKGHDFPAVTLVGVLNADQGLFGTDFRSSERLAQTIVQVAGRAGRRDQPGEVIIQTHYPTHPLLDCLLTRDYAAFAELALAERKLADWPPYTHLAVWRAEANQRSHVFQFLDMLRAHSVNARANVEVLGPVADWMERRSGRYRAQLLLQSRARPALHELIDSSLQTLAKWRESRRVRWSIDVDPIEL